MPEKLTSIYVRKIPEQMRREMKILAAKRGMNFNDILLEAIDDYLKKARRDSGDDELIG